MEAANQGKANGRVDGACGIESEEHGGQVGGVGLEEVLAIENGESFGICAFGGEEDIGRQTHQCGLRGAQLLGVPGNYGCLVREEQT